MYCTREIIQFRTVCVQVQYVHASFKHGAIKYALGISVARDRNARTISLSQTALIDRIIEQFGLVKVGSSFDAEGWQEKETVVMIPIQRVLRILWRKASSLVGKETGTDRLKTGITCYTTSSPSTALGSSPSRSKTRSYLSRFVRFRYFNSLAL